MIYIMLQHFIGISDTALIVAWVGVIFIYISRILVGVQHLGDACRLGKCVAAVVVYLHFTFLTAFGGYQDNTICGACTIYGGRSVFQYRNRFDVFRVEAAE